jgi:asparagine N-glycosylation enzyme membrane subunit Stt3
VNAQVPVKAIANGKVFLIVWLTTFSGLRLGQDSNLQMIVNADLELALLVGFGFAVVLLLIFGTVRTLRRRKTKEID